MVSGKQAGSPGEKVVEECLIEFRRSRGARELREEGRGVSDSKFLGRPHSLWGCGGQEGGPVIPLYLPAGLEVGGPRRPCGGVDGAIETIPFSRCGARSCRPS